MSYQQALKDLAKSLQSGETRHNVSPREGENNEIFTISEQESAREAQKPLTNQLTLSERLRLDDMPNQCPEHPEEDLQFFCFNKNIVVCAECLVKGAYAGMEISNLKKASDKLKGKFNELIQEVNVKHEACNLLKEELEAHEAKLEEDFAGYEEEVKKKMENLRQTINKKEQELLGKITTAKDEKLENMKSSTNSFREFQEELQEIKETIKGNVMELNDTNICHYYAKTASFITYHLNGKVNSEIEKTKRNLKFLSLQNHVHLSSFHDDCQKLYDLISNIKAQINNNKSSTAPYLLDKVDLFGKDSLTVSKVSTPVHKETKDGDVSERKRISREAFLSQCLNQLDSNSSSQVPGFTLKTTPGEQQISPKSSARQPSARSPLMTEMSKYDLNRNDYMKNFLQKYSVTNNHRSQESLSPKRDLYELVKKPKASAREDTRTESSLLSSKLSPRQNLQESSLLSRPSKIATSRKWPLENGADQFTTLKTVPTIPNMHYVRDKPFSYLTKVGKKEDIGLDLKKILGGSKTTQQKASVDKCVLRESKLKERLEQLSSRLFN